MRPEQNTVRIGLAEPFSALHITDSHIALCDERDPIEQRQLAVGRRALFDRGIEGQSKRLFEEYIAHARAKKEPVLLTGDIIDFLSEANLDYLRKTLTGLEYIYAAGNHDFCRYPGLEHDSDEVKRQNMPVIAPLFPRDNLIFSSKVLHGVDFVSMDNTYYRFTAGQAALFEAEAAKGLPIVLLLHNPLYEKRLADAMLKTGSKCVYLVGCPQALLDSYGDIRTYEQAPDADTLTLIDTVRACPLVKAIITGHLHAQFAFPFSDTAVQYVTGGTYRDEVREFTFI